MLETVRYESERRLLGAVVIGVGLAAFGGLMVLIAPGVLADVDMQALVEQFPPGFIEALGLQHIGTLEGFIALELYQFVWVLGLGAYFAYSAADTIAGDVEDGRLDTLLAAPISRTRLLVEKYLALLTPILVVNVVVFLGVDAGGLVVNDPFVLVDLTAVHALSVPYLLTCSAFGMLTSVAAPSRLIAEGVAAGTVVGTFLVESLVSGTSVSWLGAVAPMRYYDPLTILTASEYDLRGAGILLVAAFVLLAASAWLFEEAEIE